MYPPRPLSLSLSLLSVLYRQQERGKWTKRLLILACLARSLSLSYLYFTQNKRGGWKKRLLIFVCLSSGMHTSTHRHALCLRNVWEASLTNVETWRHRHNVSYEWTVRCAQRRHHFVVVVVAWFGSLLVVSVCVVVVVFCLFCLVVFASLSCLR